MGRGANTNTATVGSRTRSSLSIAEAWPMNSIMEDIAENITDVDGGIECPECLTICAAQGAQIPERLLVGSCPEHGQFTIDVSSEYDDALIDQEDTRQYPDA